MFTVDDVDWNQIPPDNNTGIQFPVQLAVDGALSSSNAHVLEANAADLSRSTLKVETDITNNTDVTQIGEVDATVTFPGHHQGIAAAGTVTVPANTTKTVVFGGLTISHPQVWWPYQLGGQPLYRLATSVSQHGKTLNSTSETFGIRTATSYLTGPSPAEPAGARAFKINGVPIVIRGGGFSPDIFLHYSAADIARQIALMKNMGVNAIRLEGHIMPPGFFAQMDRAGILVNAGYQCCDAWQLQDSGLTSPADFKIIRLSALTIGQELRDRPSVFSFQWSDDPPVPKQETVSLAAFAQAGFTDPLISSAEYNTSPKLGVSGEKEGPYDWVPPSYWYSQRFDKNDSTQTNAGGAWGYDSEQSAGDTIPTPDSLHRFMSAADLSALWRDRTANQHHANYEPQAAAVHRDDLLADEQGLAEPAVEPVRQRRRPGRQLFRGAGGEPAAARPVRAGHRHRHRGQPGRPAAGRAVGAGPGVQPRRETARRPGGRGHHAGQPAGAHRRPGAEGAARLAHPGLLRGTGTAPAWRTGGPQRVLAVHPSGRGQLCQVAGPAAGHHEPVRPAQGAADAATHRGLGHGGHGAAPWAGRRGPGHHGHDSGHLGVGGRVPAPGRRAAWHGGRPGA